MYTILFEHMSIISIDLNSTIKISLSDLEVKLSKWAPARKQIASHNPTSLLSCMGIWTLDSPFSLITLDRRTRLLLRNLNQSRLEAVRLISGCKCHRLPNLYLYFVAVELLIQVVLYQITLFRYQLIHSMTTDYRPIYEDLQKLFRIGDQF